VAQHKSAKKRARQNVKRRDRNRSIRSSLRTAVKGVYTALEGSDGEVGETAFRAAESSIRRAASKGVLSKKQASRGVSRLAKAQNRAAATS
jgi:small subunit ribosomal protein S20